MPKKQPVTKQTPSITEEQLIQLRDLMPQVFTEGKIDFDKLHASLGDFGDERPERYSFSWAGKRDAIRILQTPSRATLIPVPKESIDFDKTQNIFIEGDNLEVLKLLYKPYFGQVKMIYIDPPYNTGNDFVYPDNFADPLDIYLKLTGQKDSEGNLLTSNAETSGRYHSAWLSMMYPRLFLARQLLRDDGAIFISIDDNEFHDLRMILNEIFGEENFIGIIIRGTGQTTGQDSRGLGSSFDYCIGYSKSSEYDIGGIPLTERDIARFTEEDERGKYCYWQLRKTGSHDRREERPFLYFPIQAPDGSDVYPIGPGGYESCWRFGKSTYQKMLADKYILWKKVEREGKTTWWPYVKQYLEGRTKRASSLWTDIDGSKKATIELRELFTNKVFENPKPTAFLKRILQITSEPDTEDIVLDFFSGSSTTAQAVLELNREDDGKRKFILVQLPEPTENKEFPTIAEIGKERIRRVIQKMKKEREGQLKLDKPEDLGFKVFKLRESNYKQWDSTEQKDPKAYAKQMEMLADPLVKGWKEEDVLYEVALKEGYGLNVVVEDTNVKGIQKVSDPDKEQSFYLCLADKIKIKDVKPLNLKKDDLFICRDIALDDEAAANLSLQCRLKTI